LRRSARRSLNELERGSLRQFTPCRFADEQDQALAIATVHAELVLIHPFREGNGRCARLLAVLMGLQAGLPPLDFGGIRGRARQRYIAAVHGAGPQLRADGGNLSRGDFPHLAGAA
jgi:cell filamentation protein